MELEDLILPERYMTEARDLAANGCYEKAFDLYLANFDKFPDTKEVLEQEFRLVLKNLNEILLSNEKMPEIFHNFRRAMQVYPKSAFLFNEVGKYLYRFGYYKESLTHFQKALKLDCAYVAPDSNLNSIKNLFIERWHYRMLNDKVRNEAYHSALKQVIKPRDKILDIGTGTGLLAIYAKESNPQSLTACDSSDTMIQLAGNVFHTNNVLDVLLINKMSTDLDSSDIGGKASLIITELFDAGLFGEHILQTLFHAQKYLLTTTGRVLPGRAEFFIAGVESKHLHQKYHLSDHAKHILGVPNMMVHIPSTEPYDCEDVHFTKDLRYVTQPKSLLMVDFNNRNDVYRKLNGDQIYDATLKGSCEGDINLLVGWFNLYLSDKITITTSPLDEGRASAWQQAVFYNFPPKHISENDHATFQFTSQGGKLQLLSQSSQTPTVLNASPELLRFLNDEEYMKLICECIGSVCIYLGQIVEITKMDFVDLSPFPVFGFLMMKRGAHSLFCRASCIEDKSFIMKIFRINRIPLSKVTILVGDDLQPEVFKGLKFHAIFYNILEHCGEYNPVQKELADTLISDHLHDGGLVFPHRIYLVVQLVSSEWLNINNRVYNENVSNYLIADFLNRYQVSQNLHLDLTTLQYDPLCDEVILAAVNGTMRSGVLKVSILNSGNADACLCWYHIQLLEDEDMISTYRENSFMDSMAYLVDPTVPMHVRENGNIVFCVDENGPFKILVAPQE